MSSRSSKTNTAPLSHRSHAHAQGMNQPARPCKRNLNRAQLWNALDHLGEGVLVFDTHLNCSYANHAAEKLLGKKNRDLIGQHYATFLSATRGARLDKAYARAHKTGKPLTVKAFHTPSQRWFQHRLLPCPDGLIDLFTELTEPRARTGDARAIQARIAGILDSVMDAVISVDADQNIVYFNPAAEAMFRCAQSQVLGKSYTRFIPEHYRRNHNVHFADFIQAAAAQRATGRHGRTVSALRSDGEEFPVEASISQVTVDNQVIYTIILRDVTERHRNEAKIQKHLARLAALYQIDRAILNTYDLQTVLQILVDQVAQQLQVDAVNLLRLFPATFELRSAATHGYYNNQLPLAQLSASQSYAGRALLERRIVHLPQLEQTDHALMQTELVTTKGLSRITAFPSLPKASQRACWKFFTARR